MMERTHLIRQAARYRNMAVLVGDARLRTTLLAMAGQLETRLAALDADQGGAQGQRAYRAERESA